MSSEEEGGGSSGRTRGAGAGASQRRSAVPVRAAGRNARKAMIKDDDSEEEEEEGRSGCECFSFLLAFSCLLPSLVSSHCWKKNVRSFTDLPPLLFFAPRCFVGFAVSGSSRARRR